MSSQKLKKKARKLIEQNRLAQAVEIYRQLLQSHKNDIEGWLELGTLYSKAGESQQAAACFKQAISLQPGSADAYCSLGRVLGGAGQVGDACQAYLQATRLRPDWVEPIIQLANLLQAQGRYEDALGWYRQALQLDPSCAACHREYCFTLYKSGHYDEALHAYEQMARAFPNNPEPLASRARLLELMGDNEAANAALTGLIEQYPANPFVAIAYANIAHPPEQTPARIAVLEAILADKQIKLDAKTKSRMHYILGNLYDKTNRFDEAFEHYRLANQLVEQPFSVQQHERQVSEIIREHSADKLAAMPLVEGAGEGVVFIVGMPRSGTSLAEQILSSHHAIAGAGELSEIFQINRTITARLDGHPPYPAFMSQLNQALCQEMSRHYLQAVEKIAAGKVYVTDKMPQNFFYLGLISRLFPNARIIHCQRDLRDTCLSCYFQNFSGGHAYANNLETLGHYYNQYQRLMQHWQSVLETKMLTVNYEALVAEPQTTVKTMLDFLELEWDDNCLDFHNSARVINTASYNQVREPINQRSVARWRHYEKQIQNLVDIVEQQ